MSLTHWMDSNLRTQGYCMATEERRRLALGLRFPTAACLSLVIVALALESAPMLFVLCGIGAIAGFAARHPFDYVWNRAARHLVGAPPLPPNPPRRRHAFKIATAWLLGVAVLFATGATTAGLVLGCMLVAACSAVTLFNLCLPSVAFELIDRYRRRREPMPV
jgi:hypothetical protein